MAVRRKQRRHKPYGAALALLLALIAAQTVASAERWVGGVRVPSGWRLVQYHSVASGVVHLGLQRSRPDEIVHVARIAKGSATRMRVVLSNNLVSGPSPRTERTSSMCSRTGCLVAINGSFFSSGAPVGGVFDNGRPIKSPIDSRPHLTLGRDGSLQIGKQTMTTTLTAFYPRTRFVLRDVSEPRSMTVHGLNIARPADRIVLYTSRYGPTTETRGGIELTARFVAPATEIRTGEPIALELVSRRTGNSKIPSNAIVLSGEGAGAGTLAALWHDVITGKAERRVTVQLSPAPDVFAGLAGKPVLVRNGERATGSASQRDARTMIGWNAAGDLLLATVDGQQPGRSIGLSVIDAANLMRALGAVDALNLDGGGSTTFVLRGRLMNRPSTSSGRERAVAVAVAIVPA